MIDRVPVTIPVRYCNGYPGTGSGISLLKSPSTNLRLLSVCCSHIVNMIIIIIIISITNLNARAHTHIVKFKIKYHVVRGWDFRR